MTSSAGALIEESLLGTRHRPHIHSELQLVPSPRSSIVLLCQPPELEKWRENRSNYAIAYGKVLAAENRATQQGKKADIVHARLAGHLLLELFRTTVATSTPRDDIDNVIALGEWYKNHFVRLFRTCSGPYSIPSSHPSRSSFDTLADMTRDCMVPAGLDYKTARRKTLARDGFRCLITGAFDEESMNASPELLQKRDESGSSVGTIYACHILSQATMQGVNPAGGGESDLTENKTQYAANAMSILKSFGVEHLAEQLLGRDGVHVPENLLSLDSYIHGYFDKLNLWFESASKPNRYYVCVTKGYHEHEAHIRSSNYLRVDKGRPYVEFSRDHAELLPDPRLLDLHAVCARVAHMSGAAEAFDQLERDVEGTRVLAIDGSSAPLVDHFLIPLATISGVA